MNYQPIDCGLYDLYVLWQMRRWEVKITPLSKISFQESKGIIKDIFTKNGVEYVEIEHGGTYRLDEVSLELSGD